MTLTLYNWVDYSMLHLRNFKLFGSRNQTLDIFRFERQGTNIFWMLSSGLNMFNARIPRLSCLVHLHLFHDKFIFCWRWYSNSWPSSYCQTGSDRSLCFHWWPVLWYLRAVRKQLSWSPATLTRAWTSNRVQLVTYSPEQPGHPSNLFPFGPWFESWGKKGGGG